MPTPTIVSTPNGDRVLLPVADYERLCKAREELDDLLDAQAYDRAKAALASGADHMITGEVAHRLLAGDNPMRVWREHRGLTLDQLATKTSFSKGYLSEIETGKKDGSLRAMRAVAEALGIALEDLL
jgi:DNA-binding XRE family transcriptional regulator